MPSRKLRKHIAVRCQDGVAETLATLPQALNWLARNADRISITPRTKRLFAEADAEGSLRKLRAATRALEELVADLPG